MVADHQQTVVLLRQGIRKAEAPPLQAYAEEHLPVVERYLEMARALPGGKS